MSPWWERLRLSPSTAETEWLLGILAFLDGETSSWLNRFLLTFVTSEEKQDKSWKCETTLPPRLSAEVVLPCAAGFSTAEATPDLACWKHTRILLQLILHSSKQNTDFPLFKIKLQVFSKFIRNALTALVVLLGISI